VLGVVHNACNLELKLYLIRLASRIFLGGGGLVVVGCGWGGWGGGVYLGFNWLLNFFFVCCGWRMCGGGGGACVEVVGMD